MGICVECGQFELYYVPACGDSAVGESNILLFAGDELKELKAEIAYVDKRFTALERAKRDEEPDEVVQAQDHLAKMLEEYICPTAELPDKHLVQAYSIRCKKWTRIRSDKIRNHWRNYNIDKSLLAPKSDAGGGKSLPCNKLAAAMRDVSKKVKDDLADGIKFKGQIAKGNVSASITELWDDSLVYSGSSGYHDLSAGAQLLRAYAGFGVELGYNPKKNSYGLTGHAEACAILAEAKARFDGYVPHRDGWALIPYGAPNASEAGSQKTLNFGYFRGRLTITSHAMLGESIFGTTGIEYSPGAGNSVLVKPSAAGAKGQVSAGAFAGNAGKGGEVDFYITFENGKFMFRAKAQLVIGLGAKGSLKGTIGFDTIYEFVMYVYHQLNDNNFDYLEFMDENAFNFVVGMVLYCLEKGIDLARLTADGVSEVIYGISDLSNAIRADFSSVAKAETYAKHIKSRPFSLIFSPPEAKGAVLYRLSQTFYFSREEHQEAAILTVVGTMQSRREWEQVVEQITPNGTKSSAAAGMARLNTMLDGGSQCKFGMLVRAINNLPPATYYAGQPVVVRNLA